MLLMIRDPIPAHCADNHLNRIHKCHATREWMLPQVLPLTDTPPFHKLYPTLYNALYAWTVRIVLIQVLRHIRETWCQNNARTQCHRKVPAGNVLVPLLPMTHTLQQSLISILAVLQLPSRWNPRIIILMYTYRYRQADMILRTPHPLM
jgi:hypothetical protein